MMRQGPWAWVWDALFVLVLPPVCFRLDPVLFGGLGGFVTPDYELATLAYLGVAALIALFWIARLTAGNAGIGARNLMAGGLMLGALVAMAFGIALLPLSLMAIVYGIGLLGLVPFGTAWRYWRLMRDLTPERARPLPMLGGGLAVAGLVVAATLAVTTPIDRRIGEVRQGRLDALTALDANPFCRAHCVRAAFDALCPMRDDPLGPVPECPYGTKAEAAFEEFSNFPMADYAEMVWRGID